MKIAILGYDMEGRVSYEYYKRQGHTVVIHDQNVDLAVPLGASAVLGETYLDNLDSYDLLLRTPGLHPQKILDKNPGVSSKIWSGTNEFFKVCPTKNIIGVTGTKGKGTTSTLVARILEASGHTVHLGGNIGKAALAMLPDIHADDWVVLELSNFQLCDIQSSPTIATCLMTVPEHLDFHATAEEYFAAKANLFLHQTTTDTAIYNALSQMSVRIASQSNATKITYEVPAAPNDTPEHRGGAYVQDGGIYFADAYVCAVTDVELLGRHNLENVCAAIATTWHIVAGNVMAIKQALLGYKGLEHRLEFVAEKHGIRYYDDSFATTPETTIAAMRAFEEPKIMILGGSDKGISLQPVIDEVLHSNVRHVIAVGYMADVFVDGLADQDFFAVTTIRSNMHDIVQAATEEAQTGDVVLLSTACASFDMFKNYKDRGEQFKQTVLALS